ncbi:hypothetical protein Bbelb_212590 [Branchiostoma belcheri]|nr:hypothetical protein Bbelb_212590 [Branchiostoma belcheri]
MRLTSPDISNITEEGENEGNSAGAVKGQQKRTEHGCLGDTEYNTGYSVSPDVSARPRDGSPDGRRPEGDPTRGRAGTEGDAEYPGHTRLGRNAFESFGSGPEVRPGLEPVIERYRGPAVMPLRGIHTVHTIADWSSYQNTFIRPD